MMSDLKTDLTDTIKAIRQKRLQKEDTVMSRALTHIKELEEELRIANDVIEIMQKMRPLPHATKEVSDE